MGKFTHSRRSSQGNEGPRVRYQHYMAASPPVLLCISVNFLAQISNVLREINWVHQSQLSACSCSLLHLDLDDWVICCVVSNSQDEVCAEQFIDGVR